MSTSFTTKSKEIVDAFIRNILFVDDQIYGEGDKNHELETEKLIKAFSKAKKLCSFNNPSSEEDFDNVIEMAKKTDISVLDWKINIESSKTHTLDEEEDIDTIDSRGTFTLKLIEKLLEERKNDLKLVFIYTAETDLQKIVVVLLTNLKKYGVEQISENILGNSNFRVVVGGKPSLKSSFAHTPELKKWIIDYENMPDTLLSHFTKMTTGLVSNFALMSLSTLRNNTGKLLGLFSNEMDSAYLGHKSIIPKQEDAEELLIELFGDCIVDLLFYENISKSLRNQINGWINAIIIDEVHEVNSKNFQRNKKLLRNLLFSSVEDVESRFYNTITDLGLSQKDKRQLITTSTKLFLNKSDIAKAESNDILFANLTHHKSIFIPKSISPILTLGTLIKSSNTDTDGQNIYYVCIQQKCDSVRILKNQDRKFLFIPLYISKDKFDVLTPDGIKLKVDKSSFSIRTIKFICSDTTGVIKARKARTGKFYFKQKYKSSEENFEWILDLKDMHSQRIITQYTSVLARVGLNESEWLRRWTGN
ncbi:response regulator receiver domain [Chryseobacterium geocarposphaerae]|uniref:Response receiver domain-containing protein n=1 Tax=Chryseobacterium geocarposphaerae TaxID=1416776 RepID=A0A2M9C8Z9_9FLAO|nr:response regulator receiver domain [Chryseobacterium geocarposphaerae]PJJ67321.1 hypothetical protein CLV73_1325 [Chryseobacterium geocarposphaerae]